MTTSRYRYDKVAQEMIPLSEWMDKYGERTNKAHNILPDIQPYMAVSGDMAGREISSRKHHRNFLKRNKFVEVGNEKSYMTKNGGMRDDNPNLISDRKYEERVCRDLQNNLERLRAR